MAEGTTAIDTALSTEGVVDGSALITYMRGTALDGSPGDDSLYGGAGLDALTLDAIADGTGSASGPLQYIATHDEIAARKLAPPFWGKPFVAALLSAFMREIQRLEDTTWGVLELRTLPNADLPRLKVLGKIVGQPRLNFSTESYRILLAARGLANVSQGRASDLLAVLELLFGEGDYSLLEVGDATLYLTALQPVTAEGVDMLTQILPDTRAAGVGLQFLFSSATFADVFVWGDAWGAPEQWGSVRSL
jgi:hypothetical protein